MKTTVRWLLGLKSDCQAAGKTFKMLSAFVGTSGGFIMEFVAGGLPFSAAERSWLRLVAGCCMLKVCEQKGVGDQFTANQFVALSRLMNVSDLI
jgi:sister-chromatid-cohesion protein PDS5